MNNNSFSITVPYNGENVLANVHEEGNELDVVYKVQFPDGYKSTFYIFEVDDQKGWAELNKGATQLAVDVGIAIDNFLATRNS